MDRIPLGETKIFGMAKNFTQVELEKRIQPTESMQTLLNKSTQGSLNKTLVTSSVHIIGKTELIKMMLD